MTGVLPRIMKSKILFSFLCQGKVVKKGGGDGEVKERESRRAQSLRLLPEAKHLRTRLFPAALIISLPKCGDLPILY